MKKLLVLFSVIINLHLNAQTVPVYIYFASHNETDDVTYHGLNYNNSSDFGNMKTFVEQVCDTISFYNASYEMMLESNFILGALNHDNAYVSSADIIEWADNQPNIEVQSHNHWDPSGMPPNAYNSTDLVYLLDSCGVDTAEVLGGYIWKDFGSVTEDWTQWQTPQPGYVFANAPDWMPTLLWGGGSPLHVNDYEAYGIWRPSAPTTMGFGVHDEFASLVNFGNGCGQEFVIDDTTTAEQMAYRVINFVDSLHAKYDGNPDAFFNLKIMFNFRYLPESGYIDKIGTVLSIIDPYVQAGRMEYKGILDIYSEWQTLHPSDADYFISLCDTTVDQSIAPPQDLGFNENQYADSEFIMFPNPTTGNLKIQFSDNETHQITICDVSGRQVMNFQITSDETADLNELNAGIYFVKADNSNVKQLVIE